jgi:hypothetical protein
MAIDDMALVEATTERLGHTSQSDGVASRKATMIKRITAISGAHRRPWPSAWDGPVGAAEGHIVSFRPGEEIYATDEHPIELIVTGYEGSEEESRPVLVQLKRSDSDKMFPGSILWQTYINRQNLAYKPALVEETIG